MCWTHQTPTTNTPTQHPHTPIPRTDAGQYSPDFTYVPFGPSFATTINFKVEANTPGTNMYTSVQVRARGRG
jgi:hypothetical protein